ncbi:MAG TPA: NUDIX hydrolase [Candidatus Saccharimonadales bacterium]
MNQANLISQYPSTFYRVSLKAIIRNEKGEVLVNKEHGRDHWSLPGGGWDHGESDIECLKRELHEEVGYKGNLTAKVIDVLQEPIWMSSSKAWLLWIVYEVIPENMEFSVGEESDEIAFVDPIAFKDSEGIAERLVYKFCA